MSDIELLPIDVARRRIGDLWCAGLLPPEACRILREAAAQALTLDGLPRRIVVEDACAEVRRRWGDLFREDEDRSW